jgi:hypothetical protein
LVTDVSIEGVDEAKGRKGKEDGRMVERKR